MTKENEMKAVKLENEHRGDGPRARDKIRIGRRGSEVEEMGKLRRRDSENEIKRGR